MSDLILNDNTATLSLELVHLLQVNPGDRVDIGYAEYEKTMMPVIYKSDAGNKLSEGYSFICRGKDNDFLSQYGRNFKVIDSFGTLFLKGDQEFKVFTEVKAAVTSFLDKNIIEDTNYNITKLQKFEL